MRPKSPAARPFVIAGAAAVALACGACADLARVSRLQPAGVNVESPAAGVVLAAQSRRTPYPSFRDVPAKPVDVPAPAQYARAVRGLTAERAEFRAWEAENPAPVADTPLFADSARSGVQALSPAAPPADQTQLSTDWAKRAREAAKAPFAPPPKP